MSPTSDRHRPSDGGTPPSRGVSPARAVARAEHAAPATPTSYADSPLRRADLADGAPMTPALATYLQRTAGNAAVQRLARERAATAAASASASVPASATPVQRLVGFEFEVNVPIYRPGDSPEGSPEQLEPTHEFVTAKGIAEKTLVRNVGYETGGYKVVVDHGPISEAVDAFKGLYRVDQYVGGEIDTTMETGRVEYVTAALEESDPAWEQNYRDQLAPVVTSIGNLRDRQPDQHRIDAGAFAMGVEARLFPPFENGEAFPDAAWEAAEAAMRTGIHYRTYMQATAGIDARAVGDLIVQEGVADPARVVSTPYHQHVTQVMEAALPEVLRHVPQVLPADDQRAANGFVAAVLQYAVGDVLWPYTPVEQGTAKNIAPFWVKADLADVRKALPAPARRFVEQHAAQIRTAVSTYADALAQLQTAQPHRAGPLPLGRTQFLLGALAGDSDGFSESAITPYALPSGRRAVPIEYRSLAAHPEPGDIVAAALDVVRRVRRANGLG